MELGNLMFNQNKNQAYDCPEYVIDLLRGIESRLERIYWNNNQEELESPFQNTGNEMTIGNMIIRAYNWNEDTATDYNFKYNDLEISWYKYLGRDTTINIDPNSEGFNDKIIEYYNECLELIDNTELDLDI